MTTLALLHTGNVVIKPTNDIIKSLMPGVRIINFLDDAIVADISAATEITDAIRRRLIHLGRCAAEAKADALVVTCSSISEMVPTISEACGLPVYKIDEAMAIQAVRLGTRIGVLASLPTTMEPTCRLIESMARLTGKSIVIRKELAHEAFKQLLQGNPAEHDRILREALEKLATTEEVIVLAQASMARVLESPSLKLAVPVLVSPALGLQLVKEKLVERGLEVE
ncbi:MAG: aspartate/glutamate racemase family protein [Planctomycetota bacterium]